MDIDVDKLIELQELDTEIRQITLFLESTAPLIEDIDRKIEASSQVAEGAKEKMAASQKKRREIEAQIKDLKVQIGKYKRQLNDVKTNKEYTALLKEIEESQKTVDRLEEEFIALMLAEDDIQKEIREASQNFAAAKDRLTQEKNEIFQKKKELEEKSRQLAEKRENLLTRIPADQLSLYLKISRKKGHIALSSVRDDFCSLCHMRIRPQVLNELRDTPKLILCENCGRILYWKKESPPETEPEKVEAKTG